MTYVHLYLYNIHLYEHTKAGYLIVLVLSLVCVFVTEWCAGAESYSRTASSRGSIELAEQQYASVYRFSGQCWTGFSRLLAGFCYEYHITPLCMGGE
jgi:hypothetical protein